MKKLIIICLLTLTYTSTEAQEPTKQETMDWIGSKFRGNMSKSTDFITHKGMERINYFTYKFSSYSSGIVSWSSVMKYTDKNGSEQEDHRTYKIDLNGLSNIKVDPGMLDLYFKEGYSEITTDNKSKKPITVYKQYDSDFTRVYISLIDLYSEPDLYNRFVKALNVLVSYNSPKQKF